MKHIQRIVLAYSGGLDTSVMLAWLKEHYQADIVTFTADLGQGDSLLHVRRKALDTGASRAYVEDLQHTFCSEYVLPALRAGALYEGCYPLATALGRPLIARRLVEIAEAEGAQAVAHGCSGKGNDQVRLEVAAAALNPDLQILAPLRDWDLKSREDEIRYAEAHGIAVPVSSSSPYSLDRNLWGVSVECGSLEDPTQEPPADTYFTVTPVQEAPREPTYLEVDFDCGVPCKLDGTSMELVPLIRTVNELGGSHGVGRIDLIENRLVGIKSREIYEAPGATILHLARTELERLVLDRDTFRFKQLVASQYADLVYNGLWHSPLRRALDAFVDSTQQAVTGRIRIKLYQGSAVVVGRSSPVSRYHFNLATYGKEDEFDQRAAAGFIKLWGLPLRTPSGEHAPPRQS